MPHLAWSYEDLLGRAGALAAGLAARGVRPGDRVACLLGNGPHLVLLHLALLRAGAVLVPLNLAYRRREIGHVLSDAAPRLVVAEEAPRRLVEELPAEQRAGVEAIVSGEEMESWCAAADPGHAGGAGAGSAPAAGKPGASGTAGQGGVPAGGDDLAMLLYTSGTTGPSKGAMITHNNLLATVTGLLAAWSWQAADAVLLALPLFHVHGLVVGLDCALAAGAAVELRRRFDAGAVADELEAGVATVFFGVPTLYVRLVEELRRRSASGGAGGGDGIAAMRLFCSGSAPLAPETFAAFRELTGHAILERYGMTETGMILSNPYLGPRRPGEVGAPLPGVSVRIADEAGGDTPPGEVGELLVRGANVFAGYWRAPAKTADSFVAERNGGAGRPWFRTGDLARRDPLSGSHTLLGRRHELIITGGFNVYPREIEETLLAFPGVSEAAVTGRPHADLGEVPVAFLVAGGEPPPDVAAVLAFCRDQLAPFKVPRQVVLVPELPRNALGKLQKHLLP